jgi:hypothetical protein
MKFLTVFFFTALLATNICQAEVYSGADLLRDCRILKKAFNCNIKNLSVAEVASANDASGYIAGTFDTLRFLQGMGHSDIILSVPDRGVENEQLADIVLKFIEKFFEAHPEQLQESARGPVIYAFVQAFKKP